MGGVNTKNYHELDGERVVIGGSLDVVSGADLDIESGGALKFAGTQITASAAEANQLAGAGAVKADFQKLHAVTATAIQLNRTAVTTAGVAEASKVAVLGADKNLDEFHTAGLYLGAGAGTQVTASATQLNRTAVTTAGVAEANKVAVLGADKNLDEFHTEKLYLGAGAGLQVTALDNRPLSCSFTVSNALGSGKFIDIQLLDHEGIDLAERGSVFAYLSQDDEGGTLSTVALSTGVGIGTDGVIIEVLSKKAFHLVSEADGDIDLAITHNDTANLWLTLVLPTGQLAVSGTIAFTG